jgi:hypothetical protein
MVPRYAAQVLVEQKRVYAGKLGGPKFCYKGTDQHHLPLLPALC